VKTLVLCVDRDNDIGEKAHLTGPIVGIEENLNAARELGLADPEDTDVNALFEAAKTAKELKCEVVTLTGDWNVGIVSDEKISKQLDYVMERFKPESIILITDGAEDEQLIPIIQSRVKINAVKTVIVRQSRELEKAYFTITNFLREVEKDAGLAHLIFVIPGLVLLLIAIGGALNILMQTMLLLLAIVGLYLIVKGLGFEEEFFSRTSEFFKSLSIERISVMAYVLAFFTLLAGVGLNYDEYVKRNPQGYIDMAKTALTLGYADIVLLAFVIVIIGRIIDEYSMERYLSIRRYIITLALLVLTTLTAQTGAYYFLGQTKLMDFAIAVMLSIIFFVVIVQSTELIFIEEINTRKRTIKEYAGKKVVNKEGAEIGKVTKVLLDDSRFAGIKIGRKKIDKENLSWNDETIVAQTQ
jgi:putative membrane protein